MKTHWKSFAAGVFVAIAASNMVIPAFAATAKQLTAQYNDIKITLNGHTVKPEDAYGNVVEPFIVDGTTYLPVRAVANALGLAVNWDGASHTINISTPDYRKTLLEKINLEQNSVIFDGAYVKVLFQKAYEAEYDEDSIYVQLLVKNRSNNEVWITPFDAYANGFPSASGSSDPNKYIAPGRQSQVSFTFGCGKSLKDVETLGFRLNVRDHATADKLEVTPPMTVFLKEIENKTNTAGKTGN